MDKSVPAATNPEGRRVRERATVQVAAAITYNLVHSDSLASLPEGITIVAGRKLSLSAAANTDATANADTEAEGKGAAPRSQPRSGSTEPT